MTVSYMYFKIIGSKCFISYEWQVDAEALHYWYCMMLLLHLNLEGNQASVLPCLAHLKLKDNIHNHLTNLSIIIIILNY